VFQSFFSLVLISGAAVAATGRIARIFAILLAAVAAVVSWVRFSTESDVLTPVHASITVLFWAMLIGVILMQVFREGKINFHRIQGAIAVYLLMGLMWANFYRLVLYFDTDAFSLASGSDSTLMSNLVYFSFVTLTTVGYGDITAVHPIARSMAMVEALTGQLFPAILIARLVSMEVTHSASNKP
jgi:hypothetical protein